ncbi:helix-turn-helix domain-containing protein [Streptomyces sp. NPDC006610]|uniref:winged helix-turn-helix transcriptional regulator n=1 Tax=Streptomyces sp. NPDC006610 TaxID=3154584 RepID=UPI0033A4F01A
MGIGRRPGSYQCGVDAAIDVIGGKWKVLILWELSLRPHRFGELRRGLPGVTEKVLAAQLRELEADGIVHREEYDEVPPRVEYSLTPRGVSLNEALEPLGAWGKTNVLGGSPAPRQMGEHDDVPAIPGAARVAAPAGDHP